MTHHNQRVFAAKPRRSLLSKYVKPNHKRVARMLGFALTLDSSDCWWGFAQVIAARLTPTERSALAFMALSSLNSEDAALVADAAMFGHSKEETT